MSYIKVTTDFPITDGCEVTFKAPCNCEDASGGLKVYYPVVTESTEEVDGEIIPTTTSTLSSKVFVIKDAHCNSLATTGNIFTQDALVTVKLDNTNSTAYILNGDTNAYLENKFDGKSDTSHTHHYLPVNNEGKVIALEVVGNTYLHDGLYLNGESIFTTIGNNHSVLLHDVNTSARIVSFGYGAYNSAYGTAIYGNGVTIHPTDAHNISIVSGNDGVAINPQATNVGSVGEVNCYWRKMYASQGLITPSDRRKKKDISSDLELYKTMMRRLTPVQYRFNELNDNKLRFGFIAQDVEQIAEELGIDVDNVSFLQKEEIEPTETITDGVIYQLIYQEFIVLNTALIQDQEAKIDDLEQRLIALENK